MRWPPWASPHLRGLKRSRQRFKKYGVQFEKKNLHRAFDDIQASIAELDYYLDWFKQQADGS